VVLSYSLNELGRLPEEIRRARALLIIEPSTRENGRALQQLRAELLNEGFFAWAPCTHQSPCPLLTHSERDWCHMRVHCERPSWLKAIEQQIPVRNDTLTYSYLLLRRDPPATISLRPLKPADENPLARVIGDTLHERGKIRQAICRGPEREFFSWLTRHGEPEPLPRGAVVSVPHDAEKKGNELRIPPQQPN
jgi:ribosomal protein RSM22 (predicted rRNA methylase)